MSLKIAADGTTAVNTPASTAIPSGAAMFEAFAQQKTTTTSTTTHNNTTTTTTATTPSSPQPTTTTTSQFRDNDSDDDNDGDNRSIFERNDAFATNNNSIQQQQQNGGGFDVFKMAQDQVDQNLFHAAFQQLDMSSIQQQRAAIDTEKKEALQDSLQDDSLGLDSDWLQFLNAFDSEVAKVEDDIRKQQEVELQNSIALISDAIANKTTISLPTQSAQSKELTDHLTSLFAQFNEKRKSKETQRQQRKHNINNTIGIKPLPGTAAARSNKNKKAANKAMDRFDRLDALGGMTSQQRQDQKRRQGNGQIDFLNDNSGPYKKQLQANKKKSKKLDW